LLRFRNLTLALALASSCSLPAQAAEDWALCRVPAFLFVEDEDLGVDETRIEAQTVASEDRETIRFIFISAGQHLHKQSDKKLQRRIQHTKKNEPSINGLLLHKEGIKPVLLVIFILIIINIAVALLTGKLAVKVSVQMVSLLLIIFNLNFFRKPSLRFVPAEGTVLAAADGNHRISF